MYESSLPQRWQERLAALLRLAWARAPEAVADRAAPLSQALVQQLDGRYQEAVGRLAFRQAGRRIGCVMVHGLSSTPNCMRELAATLAAKGIDIEAVLLPGHGTQAEDLLHVTWHDWDECVRRGIAQMRTRCDRVFVLGQSLGGTLALYTAAHEPVDGVITLAAIAYLRDWRLWFLPALKHVWRWRHTPGNDVLRAIVDEESYTRQPLHAIQQLLALAARVRSELPRIETPALIVQSTVDHVAPPGNADFIYDRIGSTHKELVHVHNSYHVISIDNDRELVAERAVRFMRHVAFANESKTR